MSVRLASTRYVTRGAIFCSISQLSHNNSYSSVFHAIDLQELIGLDYLIQNPHPSCKPDMSCVRSYSHSMFYCSFSHCMDIPYYFLFRLNTTQMTKEKEKGEMTL
jgi:hypothetical protein